MTTNGQPAPTAAAMRAANVKAEIIEINRQAAQIRGIAQEIRDMDTLPKGMAFHCPRCKGRRIQHFKGASSYCCWSCGNWWDEQLRAAGVSNDERMGKLRRLAELDAAWRRRNQPTAAIDAATGLPELVKALKEGGMRDPDHEVLFADTLDDIASDLKGTQAEDWADWLVEKAKDIRAAIARVEGAAPAAVPEARLVEGGQWLCECGWANLDLRQSCRFCRQPRGGFPNQNTLAEGAPAAVPLAAERVPVPLASEEEDAERFEEQEDPERWDGI